MKFFYGLTLRELCLRGYTCSLHVFRKRDEKSVFSITVHHLGKQYPKRDYCKMTVGKSTVKFEYTVELWGGHDFFTFTHIAESEDIRSHNVDDLVITMKRVGLMAYLSSQNPDNQEISHV
tara:strand:+ start:330 stop:689 length:360 start_codon:yes stop_codon:yes gene_type:complete